MVSGPTCWRRAGPCSAHWSRRPAREPCRWRSWPLPAWPSSPRRRWYRAPAARPDPGGHRPASASSAVTAARTRAVPARPGRRGRRPGRALPRRGRRAGGHPAGAPAPPAPSAPGGVRARTGLLDRGARDPRRPRPARRRWSHGLAQLLWKHRRMIGNPRFGPVGVLALPFFLLFELLGPVVEVVG